MVMEEASQTEYSPPFFAGVDVGGTFIKLGIVDDRGQVVWKDKVPTKPHLGPEDAMQRAASKVMAAIESHGLSPDCIKAAGLGTPGTMDIPNGMILEPPNLPAWRNFAIRDDLAERIGLPVVYTNDATAAAFGEYWVGPGRNYDSMIMMTLGTGVGGGVIVFDRAIDGVNSHGSEVGHMIVDTRDDARVCSCGQTGHLEAYASATAVAARAVEAAKAEHSSSLKSAFEERGALEAIDVFRHAEAGDAVAVEIVMSTADHLAVGIVNLAHMIDPNAIVMGGAMNFGGNDSVVGRQFIQRIRDHVKRLAFSVVSERLKIEFALLGGDAGFIGAAGQARVKFGKNV